MTTKRRRLRLWYVHADFGCKIIAASSEASARMNAISSIGRDAFRHVRRATQSDVDWVLAMGGRVPEGLCDG